MTTLQSTAETALELARKQGADKAQAQATMVEVREMNIESDKITLYRNYANQNLSLKIIKDQRTASQSTNQFEQPEILDLAKKSYQSALSSPQDAAFDIAPKADASRMNFGIEKINEEVMFTRLSQLLTDAKREFPLTIIEGGALHFTRSHKALVNTNGLTLDSQTGHYSAFAMFTTKYKGKSSSFNYAGFDLADESAPLMEIGGLRELLKQSAEQIKTEKINEKFEGEIVITPHCMTDFSEMILSYLQSMRMLKKQSFFSEKLDQAVASAHWNLKSLPVNGPFVTRSFWTGDGYLSEDETIFENGILRNYLLDQYAANKLSLKMSRSQGSHLWLKSGATPYKKMISNVKKGVLLCRFSGGYPAENGDFSGVAKNSYLIENGEIRSPLSEVMVSGNLAEMMKQTVAMSSESLNFGSCQFPWVQFSGLTIS